MKSKNKTRPTIAFFLHQFHYAYQSVLWRSIIDICNSKDINLLLFVLKQLLSPYGDDSSFGAICSLVNENKVDCLIISSVIRAFIKDEILEKFLEKFYPIPIVTFSFKMKDYPAVLVDGKIGIIEAVEHLVRFHNAKEIAFIKGPEVSTEASERYSAYLEGLERVNIPFRPELVCDGNFVREAGYKAAKELLMDKKIKPDTIIAANDEMIIGVLNFLKERKITVPGEIKLVGFDNIEEVETSNPPISSIKQPLREQMDKTIEKAFGIINGNKNVEDTVLPTKFFPRESCGCYENKVLVLDTLLQNKKEFGMIDITTDGKDNILTNEFFKDLELNFLKDLEEKNRNRNLIKFVSNFLNGSLVRGVDYKVIYFEVIDYLKEKLINSASVGIKDLVKEILFEIQIIYKEFERRLLLNEIVNQKEWRSFLEASTQEITTSFDIERLVYFLKRHLPAMKIEKFLLCRYIGKVEWDGEIEWKIPPEAEIILDFRSGREVYHKNTVISTEEFLPSDLLKEEKFVGAVLPLFFAKEHFGYIVISPVPDDELLCETIQKQISTAIKGALLIDKIKSDEKKLKMVLKELKASKKKLEELSILDELTGIYNRRGFYTVGRQMVELSRRKFREFLLFFFDLDNLKKINDTFGHKEGDEAIKATGNIIKNTFRQTDVIGRIGGDEIATLAIDCTIDEVRAIEKRFKRIMEEHNEKSNKPYIISLSYGVAPSRPGKFYTLEELLEEADEKLYNAKLANPQRKAGILKIK